MDKTLLTLAVLGVIAGCASDAQLLDAGQDQAIQTAVARGKFDLDCPTVTGQVLSRELIEPAISGPDAIGDPRDEYTIGITGCGKRASYIVVCPEGGDGCTAAGQNT